MATRVVETVDGTVCITNGLYSVRVPLDEITRVCKEMLSVVDKYFIGFVRSFSIKDKRVWATLSSDETGSGQDEFVVEIACSLPEKVCDLALRSNKALFYIKKEELDGISKKIVIGVWKL